MNMAVETLTRDRLMLARLAISEWGAYKVDKTATRKVHTDFAASNDSGRYNKLLLPKAAFEDIAAARTEARTLFYRLTLPWQDDGFRVLTADAYFELTEKIAGCASKFDRAVAKLLAELEMWKAQARAARGALYNEADYPTSSEIVRRYRMDLALMPMPSGEDFRVDMDDVTRAKIQEDIDSRVASALQSAMNDVYERVANVVGHMAERLADPKAIFRDSLVENVHDLVALLPKLNATNDARLAMLPVELQPLLEHSAQDLRDNQTARAETARAARSMLDRVKEWM